MSGVRVLVVEDEFIVRQDLMTCLVRLGYEVVGTAETASEALRLAASTRPDLVLMDIRLSGGGDGIILAEEIGRRHHLPVVYLSAHCDESTLARARQTSPYGYLVKPFEECDLRVTLETALQRFRVERKLREDFRWLETLVGSIGEAVIVTDAQGKVMSLNPVAEQLLGWPRAEVVGNDLREVMRLLDRDTRQPLADLAATVLSNGEGMTLTSPVILVRRDGSECLIDDNAAPIREGPSGPVVGVVIVCRDVSERLRLSETLRQLQKMEAIGQLAGGVAHDFNNLLTIILGHCEQANLGAGAVESLRRSFQEVEKAAQRAAEITRQLLAFSRKSILAPEELEVNALLGRTCRLLGGLLGGHIRLLFTPAESNLTFKADAALLEQAVVELAINARDAMPQGGELRISAEGVDELPHVTRLPASSELKGPFVRIRVADNGPGLSAVVLAHLFEPYFTTKEVGRGSGLGLPAVYGTVKQHGGHVEVLSELGQGTTFDLYLPRLAATPPRGLPLPDGALTAGTGKTLLLVEDDPGVRGLCQTILAAAGYRVLSAGSGEEALQLSEAHAGGIDLLISDVVMPGMNGRTLYGRLSQRRAGLKVLYMSAYTEGILEERGLYEQGGHFLGKPFSMQALRQKVAELLEPPP